VRIERGRVTAWEFGRFPRSFEAEPPAHTDRYISMPLFIGWNLSAPILNDRVYRLRIGRREVFIHGDGSDPTAEIALLLEGAG